MRLAFVLAAGLAMPASADAPPIRLNVTCVDGLPLVIEMTADRPGTRTVLLVDMLAGCEAAAPAPEPAKKPATAI